MMLCLDPSLTSTGWALFDAAALVGCGNIRSKPRRNLGTRIREIADALPDVDPVLVVIEVPQIYARARSKGDPNKIAPLWALAGAAVVTYHAAAVNLLKPGQWKGQLPKTVMFRRILKRLTPADLAVFNAAAFPKPRDPACTVVPGNTAGAGDALDAIGLGLYTLGRL